MLILPLVTAETSGFHTPGSEFITKHDRRFVCMSICGHTMVVGEETISSEKKMMDACCRGHVVRMLLTYSTNINESMQVSDT